MPDVQMPRLSDSMETGKIIRWLKKEGEEVKKGEPLVEIESDKANIEVEAYASGKLTRIVVKEGDSAPIGAVIATIGEGAAAPAATSAPAQAPEATPAPAAQVPKPDAQVQQGERASAQAKARQAEAGGEQYPQGEPDDRAEAGAASAAALQILRRQAPPADGDRVKASPVARRLAEERGIDLSRLQGTGPGGRITREDVEAAAEERPSPAAVAAAPTRPAPAREAAARPTGEVEVIELSKLQATVAARLSQSAFSAPPFYITSEIGMDDAVRFREMFNQAIDKAEAISFNDLVIKAVALALTRFPEVNASWADGRIERKRDINIGFAVAMPDGLIVPVLRNADQKSLKDIARESKTLAEKARARRAGPQDLQGNTFTISNLGMYDVDQFTAIINPPDSGILAVGSIVDKPIVKSGQVVPAKRMRVTLTVDHRVFYGVSAAQFLQEVKRFLENPMSLVL